MGANSAFQPLQFLSEFGHCLYLLMGDYLLIFILMCYLLIHLVIMFVEQSSVQCLADEMCKTFVLVK